jgi:hemoglobin
MHWKTMNTMRALPLCAALLAASWTAAAEPTLYERLGRRPGLEAMVADAIGRISTDKRINAHFANLSSTPAASKALMDNLVDLICERAGGPCIYRGLNMAAAHEGMNISDAEFDAIVEDIGAALAHQRVADADRAEALQQLQRMRGAVVGH